MFRIGLTGSIASGKSTVRQMFADLGVPTFSSDDAVHALYKGEAAPLVEALFPGVVHNGVVDRAALSQRLLAAPEKLKDLEAVVHPLVRKQIGEFLSAAEKQGAALALVDVPLLLESSHDYGLDKVAVTVAPDATIRERALARPGMTVEKLDTILARQMPQAEKQERADYLFYTDRPLTQTRAAVRGLVEALRASPQGIR